MMFYGDFITSPDHVSARPPLSQLHILQSSVHFCFYAVMVQRVMKPEGSSFAKVNAQNLDITFFVVVEGLSHQIGLLGWDCCYSRAIAAHADRISSLPGPDAWQKIEVSGVCRRRGHKAPVPFTRFKGDTSGVYCPFSISFAVNLQIKEQRLMF